MSVWKLVDELVVVRNLNRKVSVTLGSPLNAYRGEHTKVTLRMTEKQAVQVKQFLYDTLSVMLDDVQSRVGTAITEEDILDRVGDAISGADLEEKDADAVLECFDGEVSSVLPSDMLSDHEMILPSHGGERTQSNP